MKSPPLGDPPFLADFGDACVLAARDAGDGDTGVGIGVWVAAAGVEFAAPKYVLAPVTGKGTGPGMLLGAGGDAGIQRSGSLVDDCSY